MSKTTRPQRADDLLLLELLDARDRRGLVGRALSAHMRRITGDDWSNSRIQGAVQRIRVAEVACRCLDAANREGGMSARWWAA